MKNRPIAWLQELDKQWDSVELEGAGTLARIRWRPRTTMSCDASSSKRVIGLEKQTKGLEQQPAPTLDYSSPAALQALSR